jgi:glycine cleavage system H protein
MVALLVIATILAFLVADLVVQALRSRAHKAEAKVTPTVHADALQWDIKHPEGVFLTPGHTWAALEPAGTVRVGMDDFARQMIGPVDTMELPKVGTRVKAGDSLVRLYKGSALANLSAPVSGEVTDVHTGLALNPAPVRRDPYGEGWMVLLKPESLHQEIPKLAVAEQARTFLAEEVSRFRGFLSDFEPALAQAADGGKPVPGIAVHLGPQAWDRFRREFLGEKI